ncbi:hypothetical protein [Tautonia rosea]|uniref:hypothetical protein n=1 Tax=Tautonia rosea TaxID=2728037 RepID=UPI001473E332|nr:hypothetical protein [Tautonia rosea]
MALKPMILATVGIMVLTVLAYVEFLVESSGGHPFPWWLYLGVALLACSLLFVRYRLKSLPIRLFLCAMVVLVAAHYGKQGLVSRKPFLQTLYRIEAGMLEAEVDQIMSDFVKLTNEEGGTSTRGSEGSGALTGTVRYRRPPQGPSNDADRGIVHFREGRVTHVNFVPD